jgi:ribosome-associated protein
VQLRFDARGSPNLPDDVAIRLLKLAGHRATQDGVIVITAQEFRSQDRNRTAAREILFELIRRATVVPVKRRATRPTLGSKERRLESKTRRSGIKAARRPPTE